MCDNWFDLLASHSLLSEGPDIAQGDRPPVTFLLPFLFHIFGVFVFSSPRTMNFSFGVTKITLGVIKITLGVLFNNPALLHNNLPLLHNNLPLLHNNLPLLENNPALFI